MCAPYPASLPPHPPSLIGGAEEAQLLTALVGGEESAWREFHRCYSGTIFRSIGRVKSRFPNLIGGDDVTEIYSDLCVQLLSNDKRRLRQFDPTRGTRLAVWLGVLARHAAYDFLRDRRRQPYVLWLGDELSETEALIDDAPDAFRVYSARERAGVVAHLIAGLSARDQEFVMLYYCQGLDPEETAERLGICVGTVYSKKHKIRARIEDLLEKRLAA